jgi:hypothetical protein
MLSAQFIRRFALIFIIAALSFQNAHAQTGTRKAPEVETPASQPAPAAPAPATSTPPAHQRIHPAGRRPGPGNAPKDAQKSGSAPRSES